MKVVTEVIDYQKAKVITSEYDLLKTGNVVEYRKYSGERINNLLILDSDDIIALHIYDKS